MVHLFLCTKNVSLPLSLYSVLVASESGCSLLYHIEKYSFNMLALSLLVLMCVLSKSWNGVLLLIKPTSQSVYCLHSLQKAFNFVCT